MSEHTFTVALIVLTVLWGAGMIGLDWYYFEYKGYSR